MAARVEPGPDDLQEGSVGAAQGNLDTTNRDTIGSSQRVDAHLAQRATEQQINKATFRSELNQGERSFLT